MAMKNFLLALKNQSTMVNLNLGTKVENCILRDFIKMGRSPANGKPTMKNGEPSLPGFTIKMVSIMENGKNGGRAIKENPLENMQMILR